MRSHPIHAEEADVCCRWLCESAGQRTARDNQELVLALQALPFQGRAMPPQPCPLPKEL